MQKKSQAQLCALVVSHFDTRYGRNDSRLAAWQDLCRDVGVTSGSSINACKRELRGTYINIVDFVQAQQANRQVHLFGSAGQLRDYIIRTKKVFPLRAAKGNPILKWMLIKVF